MSIKVTISQHNIPPGEYILTPSTNTKTQHLDEPVLTVGNVLGSAFQHLYHKTRVMNAAQECRKLCLTPQQLLAAITFYLTRREAFGKLPGIERRLAHIAAFDYATSSKDLDDLADMLVGNVRSLREGVMP